MGVEGGGLPGTCLVPSLYREHQVGPCEKETVRTCNPPSPNVYSGGGEVLVAP